MEKGWTQVVSKIATEIIELSDEMIDWFEQRTKRHIQLVQKYCSRIADYNADRFPNIIELGQVHDASKFVSPERDPYVLISWDYHCKDKGIPFKLPDDIKDKMNEATEHHVKSNSHHPEQWSNQSQTISRENRNAPCKLIDATKMPDESIAEMCADWCAMSEERNNTPRQWADKNVNIRWKFTDEQKELIYELLDIIWE